MPACRVLSWAMQPRACLLTGAPQAALAGSRMMRVKSCWDAQLRMALPALLSPQAAGLLRSRDAHVYAADMPQLFCSRHMLASGAAQAWCAVLCDVLVSVLMLSAGGHRLQGPHHGPGLHSRPEEGPLRQGCAAHDREHGPAARGCGRRAMWCAPHPDFSHYDQRLASAPERKMILPNPDLYGHAS